MIQVTIHQHKGEFLKAQFIADKARKLAIIGILIGSLSNIYLLMEKADIIRKVTDNNNEYSTIIFIWSRGVLII